MSFRVHAPDFLLTHRGHDYEHLIERWCVLAERTGLRMEPFAESEEYPVYALHSQTPPTRERGIYVSAGIHGDECGASLGFLHWAEANVELLRSLPCLLIPCLNPWGLANNIRRDAAGIDLNRCFDQGEHPLIASWQTMMEGRQFRSSFCLHEDYDAHGIYLYELARPGLEAGEACLSACETIIPREPDAEIEGREAENALIQVTEGIEEIIEELEEGLPEAIYLHQYHSLTSMTFETPSEYCLTDRVQAQMCFLETAIQRTHLKSL